MAGCGGRQGDSIPIRMLVMLLPVCLLLAAVEGAFRILPPPPPSDAMPRLVVPDPDLSWRLRPVERGPTATNELGLRDTPYKADADLKILVLGDSVSWGDGVDEVTRLFPYLLERRLAARHPAMVVEVINAGVPGYTVEQESKYLELHGLDLQPDAVIAQFCLNDVVGRDHWLTQWGGRDTVRGMFGFLLRRSRAFEAVGRWLQKRARAREHTRVQLLARPDWSPDLKETWQQMVEQLDRIRSLAAERDIPVLLLIAPYRFQVADPRGLREPQERLVQYAEVNGLPYLDLLGELEALPEQVAYRSFHDDSHFSGLGHDLVADLLLGPVSDLLGLAATDEARRSEDQLTRKLVEKARAYQLATQARDAGQDGAYRNAMALLDEAQRLAPDVGLFYQFRSNVSYLMGDRDGAIRALARGLLLEPDNPLFRRNVTALSGEGGDDP